MGNRKETTTDWETYRVSKFDGVTETAVYLGGLTRLKPVTRKLKWKVDTEFEMDFGQKYEDLTLHDISEQLNAPGLITVFINDPMRSEVFQWGNYGNSWVFLGEIQGYA